MSIHLLLFRTEEIDHLNKRNPFLFLFRHKASADKDGKKYPQQYYDHDNFDGKHDRVFYKAFHKEIVISLSEQHFAPKRAKSYMDGEVNNKLHYEDAYNRYLAAIEEQAVNKKLQHAGQCISGEKDAGRKQKKTDQIVCNASSCADGGAEKHGAEDQYQKSKRDSQIKAHRNIDHAYYGCKRDSQTSQHQRF